ncbi:MAG: hypothetical protein IJ282_05010 [Lachnospiraceae bacterium]|nr:hypothetical protein [Lachnospiraceae bacterium]
MKKDYVFQKYPFWCLATGALILFQIIRHFYMYEPWRQLDITMETVQTMLKEGLFSSVNPMTGRPYTAGVPSRYKILVLPYVYTLVCKVTGVSPQALLYELVPMLVLLGSYFVYSRWAVYLFPAEGKKQCAFMMFVALIYHLGDYAPVTDAFRMFHTGYEGTTIRAVILIPWVILACLKGKWWQVVLCIVAEAAMVWTFYGLGYCVLIAALFIGCQMVCRILEKRRAVA